MLGELLNTATPLLVAATEGTEEGLSPLVKVVPGLMIWTILAFGVSMLVLKKYAWPPISRVLDERQTLINDSITSAEKTRSEADLLLADYRQRLTEAREQADEIIVRARKAAEATKSEAVSAGQEKREELLEAARRDIEAETRKALDDIRKEVANLTVLATERVTRKTLTEADQKQLVEEALREVDFSSLAGDRSN
ncbi:MAG: F0F1 ATP synthase subunit B [Solirubrobacterales bacterium]